MEKRQAVITGDLLHLKATEFWKKLPMYDGQPVPKWTNGWLQGFKSRHNIVERRHHGEAGSVDLEEAGRQMDILREFLKDYDARDIYNMDETGLDWKTAPDRSLSSQKDSGSKILKSRITAALTCNADGSDKMPI